MAKNSKTDISSLLDEILDLEEKKEETIIEIDRKEVKEVTYLEGLFQDSKKEQKNKLKNRIEEKEKELVKETFELKNINNKIDKIKKDIELLKSRLSSMDDNENGNGRIFSISEQINKSIELDDSSNKLIEAISSNLGIEIDTLKSYITEPSYKIFIKSKEEDKNLKDSYRSIYLIDPSGYFELLDEGVMLYKGTLTWHKLVDSMLKKGFSQDPDFDNELGNLLKSVN